MSSNKTVDCSEFSDAMAVLLTEYSDEVRANLHKDLQEVGKVTREAVKAKSPIKTGDYMSGWGYTMQGSAGAESVVIRNKKKWQLTHLLEKGHAKRGAGWVSARPHIAPAFEVGKKAFEEKLK